MGIFDKTVEGIVGKVWEGELSAGWLVDYTLAAIGEKNGEINAFITVCDDNARKRAEKLDALSLDERKKLPLCGIPVAVKDNISTKGVRTTCGSKILSNYLPPYDAKVVEKLENAGAIIVAKTNMDEFAMGSSNETSFFGSVRNPSDLERVPGGSSGGSAAAVAAKIVPLALGTDTGGSIRQPASFCGTVGLKPAYNSVSRYGLIGLAPSLDQIGILANSLGDAQYLLRVIADNDEDFVAAGKQAKDAVIGVPADCLGEGLSEKVRVLFEEKVAFLKSLGAKVVQVSLGDAKTALAAYHVIAAAEASSNLSCFDGVRFGFRSPQAKNIDEMYRMTRTEGFGEEVKRRILFGTFVLSSGFYEKYYLKATQVRTLIIERFEAAFAQCDILLSPTTSTTAFKLGAVRDPLEMYLNDIFAAGANLVGCTALSVPMGTIDGLPIGIQISAPRSKGGLSYAVAAKLEEF